MKRKYKKTFWNFLPKPEMIIVASSVGSTPHFLTSPIYDLDTSELLLELLA